MIPTPPLITTPIVISAETKRYWADSAYAAAMDAERDSVTAGYFASFDARVRAEQERVWADEGDEGDLEEEL